MAKRKKKARKAKKAPVKIEKIITDKIIAKLKEGVVPWKKPWTGGGAFGETFNLVSKKPYRGINAIMTALGDWESPYFVTHKQAKEKNAVIRKGEKGTPIVFWKKVSIETDEEIKTGPNKGKKKKRDVLFMRYYTVFNVAQCDGLEKYLPEPPPPKSIQETIEEAEKIVKGYKGIPAFTNGNGRAWYRPSTDEIGMPERERFSGAPEWYSTLFHEMVHSTGHKKRLNREEMTDMVMFGDHSYSKEELTAEMGSAFLCGHAQISQAVISNQTAYIQCWLKKLENDPKFVISAAQKAQKAVDHIMGRKEEHGDQKGKRRS